jgi:tetratricopeptide (TPR) repeat protein
MMKATGLKYIFFASSAFLLVVMLILSRNAGISCDEVLHYNQSVSVFNYFASHGADKSALNTPETHLKYYGQSYDNVVTFLTRWFKIDDIYGFRHLMSSLAGWLAIFITALFATWLSGYRSGILVLFLFAISPTFMGHTQNNLKDIPFALSYIAGTWFSLKILFPVRKITITDIILLLISIAFAISIRAGGLILICYLFFFYLISLCLQYFRDQKLDINQAVKKLMIIILVSGAALILGILLWPFALQSPLKNVIESYKVMAHFPDTFRQIFEGKVEWSDFMPWYYLPKSMAITIPIVVSTGFVLFTGLFYRNFRSVKSLLYILIFFTILFPVLFVIREKSNLYSSWRQFLFLYPAIILLAATGFNFLFDLWDKNFYRLIVVIILFVLSVHPVEFMARNPSYCYIYYNQFTGGLRGAYGNYETDYYYISQTEASKWLIDYLEANKRDSAIVKATYSVDWQFRKHSGIATSYFRNEERSQYDWDYAIIANRYISPYKLKNNEWPPDNAIHIIYADSVPICAVLERKTKEDYLGYRALEEGNIKEAISHFEEAVKIDFKDEMIFYNFARALYTDGQYVKADTILKKGLEINPDFEPILMYLGNIANVRKEPDLAEGYYRKVIDLNLKYFKAYVNLSGLIAETDIHQARQLLKRCLTIYPGYKPAVVALADTYRQSDPEIADELDKIVEKIK